MKKILAALILSMIAAPAMAQTVDVYNPSKIVFRSSVTVFNISVASHPVTLIDNSMNTMQGSNYILFQSTDGTAGFCCGFSANSSTAAHVTDLATTNPGMQCARREPGGGFYELEIRRWWQNLAARCQSMKTTGPSTLRVIQGY